MGAPIKSTPKFEGFKTARFALRLKGSKIEGSGVYAAQNIPARRLVIEYTGEKISPREADRRFWRMMRRKGPKYSYLFQVDDFVVDGAFGGSGAEFINHSCEPNLYVRRAKGRIYVHSLRTIRAGEELTYDYEAAPEAVTYPCRCGSAHCRGTINLVG